MDVHAFGGGFDPSADVRITNIGGRARRLQALFSEAKARGESVRRSGESS
jgi:hypothetical protein